MNPHLATMLTKGQRICVQAPEGITVTGAYLGVGDIGGAPVLLLDPDNIAGATGPAAIPVASALMIRPAPAQHPAYR